MTTGTAYEPTPVAFSEEELGRIAYNDDGLVPAVVQDAGDGEVLMLAWMNDEALRRTLETGRTWFWSRSRQEYWCKGETSGDRQYVRASPTTATATPSCWSWWTRTGGAPATPGSGRCFYRAFGDPAAGRMSPATGGDGAGRPRVGAVPRPGRQAPDRAGVAGAGGRHRHPGGRVPPDGGGAGHRGSCWSRWRAASGGAGTPSWDGTHWPR